MTFMSSNRPKLSARRLTLATDLDGTFLGGTAEARAALYDWIEANRDTVGLIFVTGRDPDFIIGMCREEGLPWPEYVVGDVGTTIARVSGDGRIEPIPALESDIAARWNDRARLVREVLEGHPGLTLQQTEFRYRVSFDLEAETFDDTACAMVEALGLDWLISANRFFDVLPRGVSKGPSIRRLIAHLGIDADRVLVAGDTLNDLSMLECGLHAVAVGNSERALIDRLADDPRIYRAEAHGAGGILEAISAHSLHDSPKGP